ncbi:hypothetical protein [Halostella salina]|uniref:hypothetical protein n=1 Tax=Halostella salina TaxID=1547897 RepID=UPI000EF787E6|nr:hypothetical protein [Halostella salina]
MTFRNLIDPLRVAVGVFIVLGVVLTGVAGYAILTTMGASLQFSNSFAVTAITGVAFVGVFIALSKALSRNRPTHDR